MASHKVLLHICCGICSSWAIQKLKQDGFEVTGFFYNPNIFPKEEYERRLQVAKIVSEALLIQLEEGDYQPESWLKQIQGLEKEPEGGSRCTACFRVRLEKTWEKAQKIGMSHFTSTLSISPHKNSELINQIGRSISEPGFLPYNFKKEDGFKKANIFSKEHDLYRQQYCGCCFSQNI